MCGGRHSGASPNPAGLSARPLCVFVLNCHFLRADICARIQSARPNGGFYRFANAPLLGCVRCCSSQRQALAYCGRHTHARTHARTHAHTHTHTHTRKHTHAHAHSLTRTHTRTQVRYCGSSASLRGARPSRRTARRCTASASTAWSSRCVCLFLFFDCSIVRLFDCSTVRSFGCSIVRLFGC